MVSMPAFDKDIWHRLKAQPWKWRRRTLPIRLIEIHATRSGIAGRTPLEDFWSTVWWAQSTTNKNVRPGDTWGSVESFVCGGGLVARVLDDTVWPHYSLGHADPEAISIEIAQANDGDGFLDEDLDHAAQIAAVFCERHNIPPVVLDWLSGDNREAPGMVRHDRSRNGEILGKSDPGGDFSDRGFEFLVRSHLGEPATPPPPLPEEDDMKSYTVEQQWGPAMTYVVEWLDLGDGGPLIPWVKRHVLTQAGVVRFTEAYGPAEARYPKEHLALIPTL